MFGRAELDFRYAVLIDQSGEREPFNPSDPTNGDVLTSGQVNMFKMGLPAHSAGSPSTGAQPPDSRSTPDTVSPPRSLTCLTSALKVQLTS